jgi:hypothetical protein
MIRKNIQNKSRRYYEFAKQVNTSQTINMYLYIKVNRKAVWAGLSREHSAQHGFQFQPIELQDDYKF